MTRATAIPPDLVTRGFSFLFMSFPTSPASLADPIHFFVRKKVEKKYGPRIIDVDLLYYGEMVIESDFLTVPHPKVMERKFVLVPLSEIAPDFKIKGKEIEEIIKSGSLTEKVTLVKDW